jgi:hypothetical protein
MNARVLKILAWMLLYGTVGGVIAGAVSGFAVSLLLAGGMGLLGFPLGAFFGFFVGVAVGIVCGFITLWFDAHSSEVTPAYRRTITMTTLVLMPLLVLLEMWYATAGTFTGDDGLFLAAMVLCAVLFSVPISRSLIHLYGARFATS